MAHSFIVEFQGYHSQFPSLMFQDSKMAHSFIVEFQGYHSR